MSNREPEFDYLSFEDDMEPVIIFGVRQWPKHYRKYKWKEPDRWKDIAHQTGGYACNQHHFTATILKPSAFGSELMRRLSDSYLDSNIISPATVYEILVYRKALVDRGLDCHVTHASFEEGIYPVDFSREVLDRLCEDEFPKDLGELLEPSPFFDPIHWGIWILGENCD